MESLLILGPAGSGKSTFCTAIKEFLKSTEKEVCLANLDPANEFLPYVPDIDICDLISLDDVCTYTDLGPNGGLLYCIEFISKNLNWLTSKLSENKNKLILIDCPGQIELFTQHPVLNTLLQKLQTDCKMKCIAVNLIDSNLCAHPHTFIAACLVSLSCMTHLELPHINILSKIDMLSNFYEQLEYPLEFYTDISQLSRIISVKDMEHNKKLGRMSSKLAEVIEDFSLVTFNVFSVNDQDTVLGVLKQIERILGTRFCYDEPMSDFLVSERIGTIEEKYSHKSLD
jgi:GPN-loop GTPase